METNGKSTFGLVLGGLGLCATLVAGGWVILDQKVELSVLKSTKQDSVQIAVLEARMVEIETQFRAQDQIANIHLADEKRTMALIWPKIFPGEQYPGQVYFPQIARDPK